MNARVLFFCEDEVFFLFLDFGFLAFAAHVALGFCGFYLLLWVLGCEKPLANEREAFPSRKKEESLKDLKRQLQIKSEPIIQCLQFAFFDLGLYCS